MKKLQNNFTTPEQSKRLLELGVPEWTADLFITLRGAIKARQSMCLSKDFFLRESNYTPCWSVGRLMEIYGICSGQYTHNMWLQDALTCILADIEFAVDYGNIDFSKLEEV